MDDISDLIEEIRANGGKVVNDQFSYYFSLASANGEIYEIMIPIGFLKLTKPYISINIDDGIFGEHIHIVFDYVDAYDDIEIKLEYVISEDGSCALELGKIRLFNYGYNFAVTNGFTNFTLQFEKEHVLLTGNSIRILKRIFEFIYLHHRTVYESMLGN
ncbi:hypothetical protein phiOC_p097 [Ochrobactrum phage vB_OspM_OC]|nr:hypothetical protein phiOC_p097 [Ochrobactrum phage vB_OspM_OC]